MNRQQLAHLLRSACAIANDADLLVLGSQSILGSFDEDELPPEATASQEADMRSSTTQTDIRPMMSKAPWASYLRFTARTASTPKVCTSTQQYCRTDGNTDL